jgi:tetratricopeptide (TPR) repeat protein
MRIFPPYLDDGVEESNPDVTLPSIDNNDLRTQQASAATRLWGDFGRVIDDGNKSEVSDAYHRADDYERRGELNEAEGHFLRAAIGAKGCFGEDKTTFWILNRLGVNLEVQGKVEEAAAIYRRSLAGRLKVLGPEHVDTLITMHELAMANLNLGHADSSRILLERASSGFKRCCGTLNPFTVFSMANLAIVYESLGMRERSEALHEQVVPRLKLVLSGQSGAAELLSELRAIHFHGTYNLPPGEVSADWLSIRR